MGFTKFIRLSDICFRMKSYYEALRVGKSLDKPSNPHHIMNQEQIIQLKMECLKIVVSWGHKSLDAVAQAEKLYQWLTKEADTPPF